MIHRDVGESVILPDLSELPVNLMVDSSELWRAVGLERLLMPDYERDIPGRWRR